MKNFFTCIDITLSTPQPEQLFLCRQHANKNDGEVVFYGSEEPSCYEKQNFILYKLKKTKKITDVVFFTINQFCYDKEINLKLMEKIILAKYGLHFARENLKFQTKEELYNFRVEILSYFHSFKRLNRINN